MSGILLHKTASCIPKTTCLNFDCVKFSIPLKVEEVITLWRPAAGCSFRFVYRYRHSLAYITTKLNSLTKIHLRYTTWFKIFDKLDTRPRSSMLALSLFYVNLLTLCHIREIQSTFLRNFYSTHVLLSCSEILPFSIGLYSH